MIQNQSVEGGRLQEDSPDRVLALEKQIQILEEENRILKRETEDITSRLKELFERHGTIHLLLDGEHHGRIIDANRFACQFLGYTRSELCQLRLHDIQEGDPEQIDHILKQAMAGIRNHFQHRYRRKDGEIRVVEVHCSPVTLDSGPGLFSIVHDITHRVQMEGALMDSEERFRMLSELSSEGIILVESERIIDANTSFCEMTGFSYNQISGKSLKDVMVLSREGTLSGEKSQPGEGVILQVTGEEIPVEIRMRTVRYRGHKVLVLACLDLRDRLAAKRVLEENLRFLQTVMDSIPSSLYFRDREGNFGGWNSAFHKLIGGNSKNTLRIQDLEEPFLTPLVRYDQDLLITGHPVKYEASLILSPEKTIHLAIHKSPYFDVGETEPAGLVCSIFDITEQRIIHEQIQLLNEHLEERVEEEMGIRRRKEKEYENLFNLSSDLIIHFSIADGVPEEILKINDRALECLGVERSEILSRKPLELFEQAEREQVLAFFRESWEERTGTLQTILVGRSRSVPVEMSASVTDLGGVPGILANLRDVSERIRLEEEKQASERMLIQQSKLAEIGEMLGAVAHQWKQPLNTIGFLIQDLEEAYNNEGIDASYIHDFVSESLDQLGFLSLTIEEFRKFFKPSEGGESFSVGDSIQKLIHLLSAQMRNHNIQIDYESSETEPGKVKGAANKLQQILLNLINNSKDAILDQRELEENSELGHIRIRLGRKDGDAIIEIQDDGGGILTGIQDKLFQPYNSSKGEKGTGIGLYMARQIVERDFGGTIDASNQTGGACFRIQIPLATGDRSRLPEIFEKL